MQWAVLVRPVCLVQQYPVELTFPNGTEIERDELLH
jgi:hypothetical protein